MEKHLDLLTISEGYEELAGRKVMIFGRIYRRFFKLYPIFSRK